MREPRRGWGKKTMKYRYWIISLLMLTCMLSASAIERQLAGIRLGMTPKDVIDKLGEPHAIIMAQPPVGASIGAAAGENTLIYLWKDKEIELKPDTTVAIGTDIGNNSIHDWAYTVRVARLALNQQELIYRINDTFSLGITITGERNEARVTDVIACSLLPLTFWPSEPARGFNRSDQFFKDMFLFIYSSDGKKRIVSAGTSASRGKVTMGSRLDDVLKYHKWPEYFIPFETQPAALMIFQPGRPRPEVKSVEGSATPAGSTSFAFGPSSVTQADFANSYILLYPDDNLALTLINNLVIRIQIGREMARPNMTDFVPKNVGGGASIASDVNQ
jgi:hypothetical protein